jgi:hypothetical protein
MHLPEEPPSRAEAGYWSPMLEKAGVQIRGVRNCPETKSLKKKILFHILG